MRYIFRANGSKQRRQGFALLIILAFAAILAVFTAAMASQTAFNLKTTEHRNQTDKASYAAKTGVQACLAALYEAPLPVRFDYDDDGVNGTWFSEDRNAIIDIKPMNALTVARVFHNIEGMPGQQEDGIAPDGVKIPEGFIYIISVGAVNSNLNELGEIEGGVRHQATTMGVTVGPAYPPMPQAIFARNNLRLTDTTVDHFDSAIKPFLPYNGGGTRIADSFFSEASIVVDNNAGLGQVKLEGTTEIDGHFFLRGDQGEIHNFVNSGVFHPGGDLPDIRMDLFRYLWPGALSYKGENGILNGLVGPLKGVYPPNDTFDVDAIQITETLSGSFGNIGSGVTRKLDSGGVYFLDGDLMVSGSGELVVVDGNTGVPLGSGPGSDDGVDSVILLVNGNIDLGSGSKLNDGERPGRLKIYALGANRNLRIENTQRIYALIAGDDLNIQVRDSNVWGALFGNNVEVENSSIYFDRKLKDPDAVASNFTFKVLGETASAGVNLNVADLMGSGHDMDAPAVPDVGDLGNPSGTPDPGDPVDPDDPVDPSPPPPGGSSGSGGGSVMMEEKMLN